MSESILKQTPSKEKENVHVASRTPLKLSPQRVQKQQARDARDRVLKERAQAAERAFVEETNRRQELSFEESTSSNIEKEKFLSPHKKYNTSGESSWSQFMKWVPWNTSSNTLLDKDGYAVPNTGQSMPDAWRTPERIKSPDEMFYTPAAKSINYDSFISDSQTQLHDKSLITQLDEDFQKKLAIESTKIGITARKTIQGLDEVEKLLAEGGEKSWRSPMKKPIMEIPSFSSIRQSHPITRDFHVENKVTLLGTVQSDDEETLDGVSPLNSEASPLTHKYSHSKATNLSLLPKILGAQMQAEINYVDTNNRLSEKLDQMEDMLNTSMGQRIEANLDAMLNEIELFDHSLPRMELTPKHRYQPKSVTFGSPIRKPGSNVNMKSLERIQAYQNYCKSLQEYQNVMKKFISQQKKIHDITNTSPTSALYGNVAETYGVEFKTELLQKKNQAKEMLENPDVPDVECISWIKKQRKEIENKAKFYVLVWQDLGKFIIKYNIPAPGTATSKTKKNEWNITVSEEEVLPVASTKSEIPTQTHAEEVFKTEIVILEEVTSPIKDVSPSVSNEISERQTERSFKEASPTHLVQEIAEKQFIKEEKELEDDNIIDLDRSSRKTEPLQQNALHQPIQEYTRPTHIEEVVEAEIVTPTELISPIENISLFDESETDFLIGELPKEIVKEPGMIEKTKESAKMFSYESKKEASESPSFTETSPEPQDSQNISSRENSKRVESSPVSAQYFQSPRTPSNIPLLDLSALHSSGRVSIDANDLLKEEENLDDFLNRSARKDTSQRYKLDASLLNDSSQIEEAPVEKESPKKDPFNESFPKSPISPQRTISPTFLTELFKNRPTVPSYDLNLTEEELLEDVKKPESALDHTISAEVNAVVKNLEAEDVKWQKFLERSNEYKMAMMTECIEEVWKIKEKLGGIAWKDQLLSELLSNYKLPILFTENAKQEMYASEWYGVLCDVFALAGDLFPIDKTDQQKSIYSPKTNANLSKENFTTICREQLIEKQKINYVENLSRDYIWDNDPARRNAHEMISEVHNTYLRKEFYDQTKDMIERKTWAAADKMLNSHVESILNEARKSLGRDSVVSQIDLTEL